MSVEIHLERFEGPLGLLLHLIREQQMDIFDIDIAKITQQYLDYIRTMRHLDLEVAGDFVAMAATLLQIKSRMLLPQYDGDGEEVEADDPRRELVQRLLEYQKYQEASKLLKDRPWVGRDVYLRGERVDIETPQSDDVILEDNPLFSLVSAYRMVARAMRAGVHRVVGAMQSIASRVNELRERLTVGRRVMFGELITAGDEARPSQVLVTFISLLELAKMGFVSLFQSDNFTEIHIDTRRPIESDVMTRVESYDNVQAEQVADQIMTAAASDDAEEEVTAATDEEIEAEERRLEGGEL